MTIKSITFHSLVLLSFISMPGFLQAQEEVLTPLGSNHVIKGWLAAHRHEAVLNKGLSAGPDTLALPVVDDFSAPGIYPDQNIWIDSNVFINGTFSTNPPTVGMATFDGLDEFGNPYDNSLATLYGQTDKLETKPINLFTDPSGNLYTSADSITLSFYYQRRGLGDTPEFGDSLQLEFWDSASQQWIWQWSMDGGTFDFSFTRVFIKITNPVFFTGDFRFRFRSYGSLTGLLDNWHIDYVILRKPFFPNDILVNDIGYQLPAHSLIRNYSSIPYDHYKHIGSAGQSLLMLTPDSLTVFNLFNTASAPSQVNFRIWDQFGSLQYQYNTSGNGNIVIPANGLLTYSYPNPPLTYRFPDTIPGDFASFTLVDNLASPNQDFNKRNDTLFHSQIFSNYYAYDDGTSEAGYNLINSPGGKLAYMVDLLKPDTLRGMYIHWNQMNANVSLKLFKIVVWQSLTPETILYQELNLKPMYYDSINGFRYYQLSQPLALPAGSFYIGVVQSAADALNMGFDRNTDNNSKMYFNVTGTWMNSSIPGSFMMRPVFGDPVNTTSLAEIPDDQATVSVYPNPATDRIYVKSSLKSFENRYYSVTDASGRIVISERKFEEQIDIRRLRDGFYLIRFFDKAAGFSKTCKLMISR